MIMNLYTINDKVVKEAGPIFQAKNDAVAIRSFIKMIRNESVLELVSLGTYDTETMLIISMTPLVVNIPSGEVAE